jgi:hypothetical protein
MTETHDAKKSPAPLEFHPLADLIPPMSAAEFDGLVADIRAHGLRELIVLYQEKILDGRHRYRACLAAGWTEEDVQTYCVDVHDPDFGWTTRVETDDDARSYVLSANLHRRHLTAEQRRDLVAKLIVAQPEASDRAIAAQARVDHHKVAKVRKAAEATGEISPVEKRKGKDGKTRKQPARQPTPEPTLKAYPRLVETATGNSADPEASAVARKKFYATTEEAAPLTMSVESYGIEVAAPPIAPAKAYAIKVAAPTAPAPTDSTPPAADDIVLQVAADDYINVVCGDTERERNLQTVAYWERALEALALADNPELITDAVLAHCRELAERWARLAEDLAAMRKRAREAQGNAVDPDASAAAMKAAMAAESEVV